MTRSAGKGGSPEAAGAQPIVCDVFDGASLICHDSALDARSGDEDASDLLAGRNGWAGMKIVAQTDAWTMRPGKKVDGGAVLEDSTGLNKMAGYL
jgi:hypothetical protein